MFRSSMRISSQMRNCLPAVKVRFFCQEVKKNSSPAGKKSHFGQSISSPVSWASLGLMGLVGAGILIFYEIEKDKKTKSVASAVTNVGRPALGGPWVLVDHNGKPVTDATYKGRYTLLYFGFTYCPDICPSELVKIGKIVTEMERRKLPPLQPIFISLDPRRDSIGQLRNYHQDFSPSIQYLTGTPEQVAKAAKAFRVYFSKVDDDTDDDDYLVDHSIVLYFCGPDGQFLDFFTQKALVPDIVDRISKFIK
mmetsp:Transcript_40481/g.41299  ORF Transcript_40481/g.41299 Transcript_40481/m.41299 type:complete len:251 (-) Transcript_40481:16-768(-)